MAALLRTMDSLVVRRLALNSAKKWCVIKSSNSWMRREILLDRGAKTLTIANSVLHRSALVDLHPLPKTQEWFVRASLLTNPIWVIRMSFSSQWEALHLQGCHSLNHRSRLAVQRELFRQTIAYAVVSMFKTMWSMASVEWSIWAIL